MNRTMFRRMGAEPGKQPDLNKRGFKPRNTLSEKIQGAQKTDTCFTNTLKKALRWAYLSVPVIPACSVSEQQVRENAGWYALAAFVVPASVIAVAQLIKLNTGKNKKENKTG